jgi:predicted phage-related endonuclease
MLSIFPMLLDCFVIQNTVVSKAFATRRYKDLRPRAAVDKHFKMKFEQTRFKNADDR